MDGKIILQLAIVTICFTSYHATDIYSAYDDTEEAQEFENLTSALMMDKDQCISYLTTEINTIIELMNASNTQNNSWDLQAQLASERLVLQHQIETNDELYNELEKSFMSELEIKFITKETLNKTIEENIRLKEQIEKFQSGNMSSLFQCEQEKIMEKNEKELLIEVHRAERNNNTNLAVQLLKNEMYRLNGLLQKERENLIIAQKQFKTEIDQLSSHCPCDSTCYTQLLETKTTTEKERDACQACVLVKKFSCLAKPV